MVRTTGGDFPGGNLGLAGPTRAVLGQDMVNIVETDRPNAGLGIGKQAGQGTDLEPDPAVAIAAVPQFVDAKVLSPSISHSEMVSVLIHLCSRELLQKPQQRFGHFRRAFHLHPMTGTVDIHLAP